VRVWALTVVPGSSAILAGTDSGIFRSTDGGVTWTPGGPPAPAYAFAIDPVTPSTVYAVGQPVGAVARSMDGGVTWSFFVRDTGTFPPAFNAAAVTPASATTPPLIIGTGAGIWGATLGGHGGLHLVTLGELASRSVFAVADDPVSRSIVYAGTDAGL